MRLTRVALGTVALGLLMAVSVGSQDNPSSHSRGPLAVPANNPSGISGGPPVVTASGELVNGFQLSANLESSNGPDFYLISQKPQSSYEVVVDATSGDITPVGLERLDATTTSVLQASVPVGTSQSRSLRWTNLTSSQINDEFVRVRSGGCTSNCGSDDVYRIRAYETTYAVPRFNNSGTQVTVLLLQNPTDYTITGTVFFWSATGVASGTSPFSLAPKALIVLNTATVAPGVSGALTIAHDGRFGDLSGKTVALEPATGFSFDTPALPRLH